MPYVGKKATNAVDVAESQSLTVDGDLTVDTNTLHVDASLDGIGIGTTTVRNIGPDYKGLNLNGTVGGYIDFSSNGTRKGTIFTNGTDLVFDTVDPAIFAFLTGSSERVRIDSNGLKFNGDTASANALDDYEEGTWTPTHGGNNMTQSTACRYTKIGRAVFLVIDATSASGSSATHLISGLPFTSTNSFGAFHIAFTTGDGIQGGYVSPSSNNIILIVAGTNTTDTLNAGTRIIGTGMYFTA